MGRVDDPQRAREALDEVRYRQRQASTHALLRALPWWCAVGLSVVALGQGVLLDLQLLGPGREHWDLASWLVGTAVVLVLVLLVQCTTGLQPRGWAARAVGVRVLALVGVYLVSDIVVGTVLRALDLPWDQTAGAVGGLVAAWVLGLHRRRSDRAGTARG